MDLSKLTKKTLKVSRGFTYTYYSAGAQEAKPTIALFHGWPDSAKVWAGFVNDYLLPHGYGVIAQDCLGYGETSKPTDIESYGWQHITTDIAEILDAENVPKVISLGHDWGSGLAQRLYHFYPSRVQALVMVNAPYMPPSGDFDLDSVNARTREAFGMGLFEYWHFFASEDGPGIMNRNLESVYSALFGDPHTWQNTFCTPGGMRKWISEGHTQPTLQYATPEHKADFMDRFSEEVGFQASCCYYKSTVFGVQNKAEKLAAEGTMMVNVPTLFWGVEQDYVCRPAGLQPSIQAGLLPNLKIVTREGGHWALLEKPAQFGQDVLGWLQETF
ncbi:putative epoxide hydrolase [Colletotrichum truncatum]|uniref:Epoxide hydrolase n=1 Tax=Colletotrichum truncatum TaxID=5467 RepID=A0ACC3YJA6_COLTU|nr:putative epoxide hydrolase [Colletotrichum truncatum]KAF6797218.1 putative epoxide hydrolase [Colletotrichum truncatum]